LVRPTHGEFQRQRALHADYDGQQEAEQVRYASPKIQTIFGIHFMAPIGTALVMETTQRSGSFTLGFRIDPPDKLDLVLKVRLFCPPASPTSLIAIQFHYIY
jgi:hypothetical protein